MLVQELPLLCGIAALEHCLAAHLRASDVLSLALHLLQRQQALQGSR